MITDIHETANISEEAIIECERFTLGKHSYIGPGVKITCKEFYAGDYLWMPGNSEVGRGGCNGPNSIVEIGDNVGIFEGVVINPSESVSIGNDVGIGAECLIWTHGAWLDPLKGFPFSFEDVTIGNNVWLPARSIMLPGTNIGDNVVIGTGSIITQDIPSGSLAVGSPCKVIKENHYPKNLSEQEKGRIVFGIVSKWQKELIRHKGIETKVASCQVFGTKIILHHQSGEETRFDCGTKTISGVENEVSEDLRDYLRRHGIRILSDKPFKSVPAAYETRS